MRPILQLSARHWGEDGIFWRWSDGGVEATSLRCGPCWRSIQQNKLIEPVTNWLIKNRRGAQWSNTRDTAIVVLTLNDYLRMSGELSPSWDMNCWSTENRSRRSKSTAEDALSAPSKFAIPRELIRDGANEITIRRQTGSRADLLFGRSEVLQSGRTVDSGGQRNLRAAAVLQTGQSSRRS